MSSSSDPPSGGSPDTYGSSERSEELEVGIQQLGFSQTPEGGQLAQELAVWQGGQDAQKLPPIPTVEANEVGEPGPSGLKGKALADVTSTFNVMRPSPKKRTTASQDDVQVRTTAPLLLSLRLPPDMPFAPFTGTGKPTREGNRPVG